jgi:hypothetical protein
VGPLRLGIQISKTELAMLADMFSRFEFGELMGFLAVGGGLVIALVAVAGGLWVEMRKTEINAALKQDMLSRDMSPEEIKMVLDAGTHRSRRHERRCSPSAHSASTV